ncbi:class I SAM-dependent methyltransferase [Paenibacillus sp. CMAA1739]|uniref:class I SAM-dependent methyltransferase n=1 Tax=Paenibacillus ottowii TaxID=2315729 RepID=UPI002730D1C8|nr:MULTISPECIES: class I SAM-dependent methyltransferase [Paenibacillus]MDP1508586.1 class I SAM-dependent methyltransferase [Paenibacillus ottowii]MEC4565292.1 class I SAM-dependent methyltransferase [Paenibacillus sp. CMAA1739]
MLQDWENREEDKQMVLHEKQAELLVTTGDSPSAEVVERAKLLAAELGVLYAPRRGISVAKLIAAHQVRQALVLVQSGVRLIGLEQAPMVFHPSMGFIRAKRVLKGEPDPMLTAARLVPGDTVLDCTAGLGTDSLLFSIGTGSSGQVTAVESSFPVYALIKDGMRHYRSGNAEVDRAFSDIDVHFGHHLDYLRSLPNRSVDIIYFDPMFRDPLLDSSAIGPLRGLANPDALEEESILQAKRVARKTIVLKEKRGSGEFDRLGFRVEQRGTTKTVYGVIDIDSGI